MQASVCLCVSVCVLTRLIYTNIGLQHLVCKSIGNNVNVEHISISIARVIIFYMPRFSVCSFEYDIVRDLLPANTNFIITLEKLWYLSPLIFIEHMQMTKGYK